MQTEYQKQQAAEAKVLTDLMTAVAPLIGGKINSRQYGDPGKDYFFIDLGEGREIEFRYCYNDKSRVRIDCRWPSEPNACPVVLPRDCVPYSERDSLKSPDISCAISRGPERIAADIKRRTLPLYFQQFELCKAEIARRVAYTNEIGKFADDLASACGGEIRGTGNDKTVHLPYRNDSFYGDFKSLSGGSCYLELRSLKRNQALKLAAFLQSL